MQAKFRVDGAEHGLFYLKIALAEDTAVELQHVDSSLLLPAIESVTKVRNLKKKSCQICALSIDLYWESRSDTSCNTSAAPLDMERVTSLAVGEEGYGRVRVLPYRSGPSEYSRRPCDVQDSQNFRKVFDWETTGYFPSH